jgi:hypothetical protein
MISLSTAPDTPPNHVIVRFGSGIPADLQSISMLRMEKLLRELGVAAEVYKETAPDDSRLRRSMTKEQRDKL